MKMTLPTLVVVIVIDGDDDVQFQESIEEEHPGSSGYIAVK